jgi:hypothetical protein
MLPGRSFEVCVPVVGDQRYTVVEWKCDAGSDLGFEKGQPICLRFQTDHAQIFGLEFE